MQTKRFIGENPKVGIRPVIDGRQGGVRESLEEQTMNMAKSAAKLIRRKCLLFEWRARESNPRGQYDRSRSRSGGVCG